MIISKKDWKLFCEKLCDWQEKYIESLIHGYVKLLNDDTKLPSEKYWELKKKMEMDKHHPGSCYQCKKV